MNIVLLGAPGAGKGTQGNLLARKLDMPKIATGDLLRAAVNAGTPLGKQAQGYMNQGDLVPDAVILGIVEEKLASPDASKGVIMDGFPRTIAQAEAVDELLSVRGSRVDRVVTFDAPDGELVIRMLGRAEEEGRTDDTPDTIRKRLEVYRTDTAPLIAYYERQGVVTRIDATGTIKNVARRVDSAIGNS
jgi:adenylate kinase